MVREFEIDWHKVKHENLTAEDSAAMNAFFHPAGAKLRQFDNPQSLDEEGLLARALSSSYLPLPGQDRCEEMLQSLRDIFRRFNQRGRVVQRYTTKVYYGALS
jgi:hypothetical protein